MLIASSHAFVIWATATFGWNPSNDLVRVGDVAGFAVNAIRGVDLQFRRALFHHHLVDRCGTKILARISKFADAPIATDIRLEHDQVAWLVLVVPRAGVIDVGEAVERQLAVAFESR